MRKFALIMSGLAVAATLAACEYEAEPTSGSTQGTSTKLADKHSKDEQKTKKAAAPSESMAQANARRSAESYLDTAAFSRSGLIDQLKFEDFSTADATYAVGALTVDWKKQAAKAAESYLDTSSFSRAGLIDQLKFEGFTQAQAASGVEAVGY
jgi:host cell surface-exposed lipoprotein